MDPEFRKSLNVPAIWANRIHVARTTGGVRIAFGEILDGEINYRSAVMLADSDAIAMRDLLNAQFPPAEKQH